MKHNKTLLGLAVAGLMGLSPYALAEGWGDKTKQKMEAGGEKVEQGAEKTGKFFGDKTEAAKDKLGFGDKEQAAAAVDSSNLSKDQVVEIQKALNTKGFHAAAADGEMGETTTEALKNFQEDQGFTASGELNQETIDALGVDIDLKQAQEESEVAPVEQTDSSEVEAQEQQESNLEESVEQQEPALDEEVQQQQEPALDEEVQQQQESVEDTMEPQQQEETSSAVEPQQQEEAMDAPHQSAAVESSSSPLSTDQVSEIQTKLNEKGFTAGNVDGIMGPETQSALESFQSEQGISASGELNQETIDALGIDVNLKQAQEEAGSQMFSE